jgi:quercetin dioxygenase-like cupin family protein
MREDFDIDCGALALAAADRPLAAAAWVPHPKFPGVAMRAVALAADTGGAFSQHQVRVDPGCAIGDHTHPDHWESHLVLGGTGTVEIAGRRAAYAPGSLGVMPKGVVHRVGAGSEILYILATFVPALA